MNSLSIQTINNKDVWEAFILSRKEANFLQSYNWGEFHQSLGKKVFYFGLFDGDQQIGACLVVKEEAKRGNYLTIAGGPILDWEGENALEYLKKVFDYLKDLAKKENCVFIRIRPQAIDSDATRSLIQKIGLKESPMHLTADLTLQLDLSPSEEDLLKQMRKNTRYEVRKVERENITVRTSQNPEEMKEFYEHQLVLAKKHNFVPFSYEFLKNQFDAFVKDDQVMLFHSYKDDKLLASAFIIFYNKEAVYHYGISTPDNQRLPGSYACQWASIKEAKNRGCTRYNFWGIAHKEDKEHRFAGVSLFKRGFGGEEVQYLSAHDLAVSWKYAGTKGFEMVRKKMRGL